MAMSGARGQPLVRRVSIAGVRDSPFSHCAAAGTDVRPFMPAKPRNSGRTGPGGEPGPQRLSAPIMFAG